MTTYRWSRDFWDTTEPPPFPTSPPPPPPGLFSADQITQTTNRREGGETKYLNMKSAESIREKEKQQQLTGSQIQHFTYREVLGFLEDRDVKKGVEHQGTKGVIPKCPPLLPTPPFLQVPPPHPNSFYPKVKLPKPPTGGGSDRQSKNEKQKICEKGKASNGWQVVFHASLTGGPGGP